MKYGRPISDWMGEYTAEEMIDIVKTNKIHIDKILLDMNNIGDE